MVEQEVLRVVRPAAVEAAMQAHQEMVGRRNAAVAALEEDLKAARYAAQRAQRQYDAADPLCGLPGYVASGFYPQLTASIRFIQTPHNSMH
jgi:hypothetical protein